VAVVAASMWPPCVDVPADDDAGEAARGGLPVPQRVVGGARTRRMAPPKWAVPHAHSDAARLIGVCGPATRGGVPGMGAGVVLAKYRWMTGGTGAPCARGSRPHSCLVRSRRLGRRPVVGELGPRAASGCRACSPPLLLVVAVVISHPVVHFRGLPRGRRRLLRAMRPVG